MNCPICEKQFSRISNLNRHKKTSKCSKVNKCIKCNQCFIIDMEDHIPLCSHTLLKTIRDLQDTNERYISKITILQDKIATMAQEKIENKSLDELKRQITELSKKVEEKQVIHVHNHNNNIKIDNLQVLNTNDFYTFTDFLTIDHIKKGAFGYAEYAMNYPLNQKIVCTDFSRRKIKYKTDDGKVKNDINMVCLSKDLFKSIDVRNKAIHRNSE